MNRCEACEKPKSVCICSTIQTHTISKKVVILQHPQEPKEVLSTAKLITLSLQPTVLKTGLSWRNLSHATGVENSVPSSWAVLYLGKAKKFSENKEYSFLNKKDALLPEQDSIPSTLDGILVLDGTWSQAKTLWWRNAWLLKCRRLVLHPKKTSLYKNLRKEPRKECISTLESVAYAIENLWNEKEASKNLIQTFETQLKKIRERHQAQKATKKPPIPAPVNRTEEAP